MAAAPLEIKTEAFTGIFDVDYLPARLTLKTTGGKVTAADERDLLTFLRRAAASQVPHVAIFDLRVLTIPTMDATKRLIDFCRTNFAAFSKVQKAISVLLQNNLCSGVVRRLISVVSAAVPPACPLLICHSPESAEAFFVERCIAPVRIVNPRSPGTPPVKGRTFMDLSELEGPRDPADTPAEVEAEGETLDGELAEGPVMQAETSERKRSRFASKISFDVQELQADQQALKVEPASALEQSNAQALHLLTAFAASSPERPRWPAKAQQPGPLFGRLRSGPSCAPGPLALFSGCHHRCGGLDGQVYAPVACREASWLDVAENLDEPRACVPHIAKPIRVACPGRLDSLMRL